MAVTHNFEVGSVGDSLIPGRLEPALGPILAKIAAGAVQRERERTLPFAEVDLLRHVGFGALRVPVEYGGGGILLRELFAILIELGTADSNLPQLFRGHFAFLEGRLNVRERDSQRQWFELAVSGMLFGNAQSERGTATGVTTVLEEDGEGYRLNGTKYYSTGTLFADWIWSTARAGEDRMGVALPTDAAGVTRLDDWDGFGQRLTGSGTTRFESVPVPADQVIRLSQDDRRAHTNITAFYQLVLLATLAGIGRRALADVVEFVRPRTRTFGVPEQSSPRADPLVQNIVGQVSARANAATRLVLSIADELDRVHAAWLADEAKQDDFDRVEIAAFETQDVVINLVLDATTRLFEVGGASATSEQLQLDRHWRNARTVASHNPLIYRDRAIGDYRLNGTTPVAAWHLRQSPAVPAEPVSDQ